jgi:NAD(P)-dependent dehydrogenase (short-subunit alcohol dehydrogenase family)
MKTVLITGIGKGIGKAIAQKFLLEGCFVVGTSKDEAADYTHDNLVVLSLDLSSRESISAVTAKIEELGRKVDYMVNNAGVLLDEEETAVNVDKLRTTLEVNLIGPIDLTERVLPFLNQGAHIVNMSSAAGSLTLAGHESHHEGHYPAYKISKTAINMYTKTLALRLAGAATVSSIHPGWVRTDMGGDEAPVTPEEAAESVYALAVSSPASGEFWYNGKNMPW